MTPRGPGLLGTVRREKIRHTSVKLRGDGELASLGAEKSQSKADVALKTSLILGFIIRGVTCEPL